MSSERAELIERVRFGGRELSTATVMLHTAIAEASGLTAVETKAIDFLDRFGPLSHKGLTEHSGLAPASVTALIDRLERKDWVRRVPHPGDGRRLLVELNRERVASAAHRYNSIAKGTAELCEQFDDEQLRTILAFIDGAVRTTFRAASEVTEQCER